MKHWELRLWGGVSTHLIGLKKTVLVKSSTQYDWIENWNPLENLSDAFQVMEKIGANKFNTEIIRRTDGMYFVTFKKVGRAEDKLFEVYASGETVQKAVCNAAMKVVA